MLPAFNARHIVCLYFPVRFFSNTTESSTIARHCALGQSVCVGGLCVTNIEATAAVDHRLSDSAAFSSDTLSAEVPFEFISFSIGEEQYGVAITAVREIKGWTSVTHLPRQPDYVRGVLNLRGVMVPIIDLRSRFGQGTTDATPMHVVIIVQINDKSVGILADRVLDIVSIDAAKIQAVPRVVRDTHCDLLSGLATIESGMIAVIDLQHLVASDDSDL
jgi:purine-binding chemotaxis protein CheW